MRKALFGLIVVGLLTMPASEALAQKGKWGKGQGAAREGRNLEKMQQMKQQRQQKMQEMKEKRQGKQGEQGQSDEKKQAREAKRAEFKAKREAMKEKWAAMSKDNGRFQALKERIEAMQQAKHSGDATLYKERKTELQKQWQAMTPEERQQLGQQIPELNERMKRLAEGDKTAEFSGTRKGPKGKETTVAGTRTRDGNVVNTEKTITGPQGNETSLTSTTTKEGNTLTTVVTGEGGKTATHQVTGSTDGEGLHTTSTTTGPGGETFESSGDWMFDFIEESDY